MNFLKDDIQEIKYLKEITLIIINLLKEAIILFVALIVILNYANSKDNDFKDCEMPSEIQSESVENFRGPWNCIQDIMNQALNETMFFLKTCTSTFASFIILIGLLYYFFNVINTPKPFSFKNTRFKKNTFDTNIQIILKDMWNKLTFILLFPTLFISTVSLFFICIKILFDLPTRGPEYGFIMAGFTKLIMFLLFPILFFVIGQTLYYLLTSGNISYLYNITALDSMMYIISFVLISILIFAGFYKLLIFNLRSTFVPDTTYIINKLYDKEIIPFSFVIQIILFVTILKTIKQLFPFEIWIFAIIISIIFVILLGQTIYMRKSINSIISS